MNLLLPSWPARLLPRVLFTTLAFAACGALAQDRADIERTPIIGNRELPKVLYIVPWKKPVPGPTNGRPLLSVLDEALAPIDRDEFRRALRYDSQINPRPAPTSLEKNR